MVRISAFAALLLSFALTGCEKPSAPQSAPEETKPVESAKPKAVAKNKTAVTPKVSDSKRSPECLAALDSVKALKAAGKASPEDIKKAVGEAMNVCAKAHPTAAKKGATPDKPVEPAVPAGTPPEGLAGRWTIDPKGIEALPEFQKLPEGQRAMTMQMFQNLKMEIQFGSNELATNGTFMGQLRAEKTAYKTLKREGNVLTIETKKGDKVASQIWTIDGDRLLIKDVTKNNTLVLKRMQ
ncbi:MAG: hypothetical protein CMH52_03760 [Myxococcales bacterium]|nr:hypothetical protein [Myxococcales bacterium]|tara:strand:+ start:1921 stop:2637 length:717 start_codon:yes stop_codon:yes gene_type:complete